MTKPRARETVIVATSLHLHVGTWSIVSGTVLSIPDAFIDAVSLLISVDCLVPIRNHGAGSWGSATFTDAPSTRVITDNQQCGWTDPGAWFAPKRALGLAIL